MEVAGESATAAEDRASRKPEPEPNKAPLERDGPVPASRPLQSPNLRTLSPRAPSQKPVASPAVRGRALEAGLDLRQVRGSGPAGRISHEDLDAYLNVEQGAALRPAPMRNDVVEKIKVTGLRRRIAERMAESTRRVAHFSYVEEVDVTALEELRAYLNERHGAARPKLTVLPFLIRAMVLAIPEFPQMNALYDDENNVIARHSAVHVGIATQTATGLMVPVLRPTEDLWDCAGEIGRIAAAARDGSAGRDDLTGSTITVTSLGELGGLMTTPVINRPEVAIVGVNKISTRPVWLNGQFVPRKMMNLSSSFDHRVIDGYDAARFIQRIRGLLEMPAALFIEVRHG